MALDVDGALRSAHLGARAARPWARPWEPWEKLGPEDSIGEPIPAVTAQIGGRLVLFTLRNMPDGPQTLDKLEQEGGTGGLWLAGDPIETKLLGQADSVPKADSPVLASDGHERLRLFLSIPGSVALYNLNQVSAGGGQWLESWINFQAP